MACFDDTCVDDTADTQRFVCPDFDFDGVTDVTATYDVRVLPSPPSHVRRAARLAARRLQIHATRQCIVRLREAIEAGWDVSPELEHEEQRLAELEAEGGLTGRVRDPFRR